VCTGCGRVRDLYADFAGLEVPEDRGEGFRAMTAEVVFRGLCPDCQPTQP
jgi:Fe2+ or Zn2+ uptake regulation protein